MHDKRPKKGGIFNRISFNSLTFFFINTYFKLLRVEMRLLASRVLSHNAAQPAEGNERLRRELIKELIFYLVGKKKREPWRRFLSLEITSFKGFRVGNR